MANEVSVNLPWRKLGGADAEFKVKIDNAVIGTLKISKGDLEWVPRDAKYGYKVKWADFGKLMEKNGSKAK